MALYQAIERIKKVLWLLFFFFLPFVQALTFKVGFPLKLSEFALFLLLILYVSAGRFVKVPKISAILLGSLILWVAGSVVFNLFAVYDYPLRGYVSRFGYTGDSVSRFVYFLLAVAVFLLSVDAMCIYGIRPLQAWVGGAVVAASYSCYLTLFSALGWPVLLLPGMESPPQVIMGGVIRCGTFPEGNSMGLFLLVSAVVAVWIGRRGAAVFLLISILSTFATLSIVCGGIIGGMLLWDFIRNWPLKRKCFLLAVLLLMGAASTRTQFVRMFVVEKLVGSKQEHRPGNKVGEASFSRMDRLKSIEVAGRIGRNNPVWGVGLSNYSRHYGEYFDKKGLTEKVYREMVRDGKKVIPNNMYMELFAEAGIPGLLLFLSFLLYLLWMAIRSGNKYLSVGMFAVLICGNAWPSFIMIFLWAFFAFVLVAAKSKGNHIETSN